MFANRGVNQSKITYDYNEYIKSTIKDYYQLLRWAIFYSQIEQIKQIAMDFLGQQLKTITNYFEEQNCSQIDQIKQIAMDYLCSRNNRSNGVR